MSKYTTEVRYICEEAAGLDASVGYNDVEQVVQTAYPKIFNPSLEFYNEETKARLLPKILIHYYQREIGFETVGLWKLKLNQKMREILPYYNQLYASEALEYDPLKNVDNRHTHTGVYEENTKVDNIRDTTNTRDIFNTEDTTNARDITNTRDTTNIKDTINTETRNLKTTDDSTSSFEHSDDTILRHSKTTTHEDDTVKRQADTTSQLNDVNTHAIQTDGESWVLFSDTPQGGINGVQNGGGTSVNGTLSDNAYLTNATHTTEKPAATQDTMQHGTITNTYGNVTNEFGDIVETYNKDGDKKDHVDKDGWDKYDNENNQTGTISNDGNSTDVGKITDIGKITDVGNTTGVGKITDNGKITDDNTRKNDGTDSYTNNEFGKIGVMTYQEMQMRWRESFLNIDMQIIDELDDLFMKVW